MLGLLDKYLMVRLLENCMLVGNFRKTSHEESGISMQTLCQFFCYGMFYTLCTSINTNHGKETSLSGFILHASTVIRVCDRM